MTLFRLIAVFFALTSFTVVSAQMRIIPREHVEAVSNPKHSSDSAYLLFVSRHMAAEPMNEDDAPESFVFPFRNIGDKELRIARLVTTCSCLTAFCNTETIAPGADAEIVVRYDPKGHPITLYIK